MSQNENKTPYQDYSTKSFVGITAENFVPIYLPLILGLGVFAIGIIIDYVISSYEIFNIVFGLSGILFSLSGIGQIRLKEVPGFPLLRGGCAVVFGLLFLLIFATAGILVIFLE